MSSKYSSDSTIHDKPLGQSYSVPAALRREETKWLLVNMVFKGRPSEHLKICQTHGSYVIYEPKMGWQDHQSQSHDGCPLADASLSDVCKMYPRMGEMMQKIGKASMELHETILQNLKEQQAEDMRTDYVKTMREGRNKRAISITEDAPYAERED